jgi:hypothetical protein
VQTHHITLTKHILQRVRATNATASSAPFSR